MLGTIRYVRDNLAICGFVGIGDRRTFAEHGFSGQIQCAEPFDPWLPEVCDVLAVPFLDGLPIPGDIFERARKWFLPKWERGEKVLVSCAGGSSRSVSIGTALLVAAERIPFRAAIDGVLRAIPGAYPHPLTLASAAHFSDEVLSLMDLQEIYRQVEFKPPYPWPDELIEAAAAL